MNKSKELSTEECKKRHRANIRRAIKRTIKEDSKQKIIGQPTKITKLRISLKESRSAQAFSKALSEVTRFLSEKGLRVWEYDDHIFFQPFLDVIDREQANELRARGYLFMKTILKPHVADFIVDSEKGSKRRKEYPVLIATDIRIIEVYGKDIYPEMKILAERWEEILKSDFDFNEKDAKVKLIKQGGKDEKIDQ